MSASTRRGSYSGKFSPRAESEGLDILAAEGADDDDMEVNLAKTAPKNKVQHSSAAAAALPGGDTGELPEKTAKILRKFSYSMNEPVDYIRDFAATPESEREASELTRSWPDSAFTEDKSSDADEDEVSEEEDVELSEELVQYFKELILFVAQNSDCELDTGEAEDMLRYICSLDEEEISEVHNLGALNAIYNVMDRAFDFESLVLLSCHSIRYISSTPDGEKAAISGGVVERLMYTIESFKSNTEITTTILCTLAELACNESGQKKLFKEGVHLEALKILDASTSDDVYVRIWACSVIGFLADGHVEAQAGLVEAGALTSLISCTQEQKKRLPDERVCQMAIVALDRILRDPAARAKFLEGSSSDDESKDKKTKRKECGISALLRTIEANLENSVLLEHGCGSIAVLCEGSSPTRLGDELTVIRESGAEKVLLKILDECGASPQACSCASHALKTLSDSYSTYIYRLSYAYWHDFWGWSDQKEGKTADA